jgi:hypothetical protein
VYLLKMNIFLRRLNGGLLRSAVLKTSSKSANLSSMSAVRVKEQEYPTLSRQQVAILTDLFAGDPVDRKKEKQKQQKKEKDQADKGKKAPPTPPVTPGKDDKTKKEDKGKDGGKKK